MHVGRVHNAGEAVDDELTVHNLLRPGFRDGHVRDERLVRNLKADNLPLMLQIRRPLVFVDAVVRGSCFP